MLLLLIACTGTPADTGETADTADTSDTADTGVTPLTCGSGEPFAVPTSGLAYELSPADSGDPHTLTTTVIGDDVNVVEVAYGPGCCPTLEVTATADPTACTLVAYVVTLADDCDCVGTVNPSYTLNDLPLGEWTLTSGDASATFVVE